MDLFSNTGERSFFKVPIDGGELLLMHDFISGAEAHYLFNKLDETVAWKQETLALYGKAHLLQRQTAWYGDEDRTYHYSNLSLNPLPWTPELLGLKDQVEAVTGDKFNTVLLNKYRNGSDKVGWHSDYEKAGSKFTIASLSLGSSRYFDIRKKLDNAIKLRIELHSGTLLVMKGEFQHNWQHQIPVQKLVKGSRINLTFRKMIIA